MRLGYSWDSSITFGRCIANRFAAAKGRRLGAIAPGRDRARGGREGAGSGKGPCVSLLDNVIDIDDSGPRSVGIHEGHPIHVATVQKYLERVFGPHLALVRDTMHEVSSRGF